MVVVKIVGTVVKLVGSGIGLGREAYLYHKEKQETRKGLGEEHYDDGVTGLSDSMSRAHVSPDDHDIYIQLPEEHAHDLIAKGHAIAATEEEKRDLKHIDDDDDDDDDDSSIEHVERDWELDEEAGLPPAYEEHDHSRMGEQQSGPAVPIDDQQQQQQEQEQQQNKSSVAKLVNGVVASAHPTTERHPLAFPVIMPQRRPGAKSRGFVRAYAPDLAASGISQETFLLFLNNLDLAAQASPALRAIFVSAGIVGLVPGSITFAVSLSVQILVGAAMELESRYKANAYLDQLNKELFMPRGLYAMVMRYKPGTAVPSGQTEFGIEDINIETAKNVARRAPGVSPDAERNASMKIIKQLRISSGVTKGEATMPTTCATLIFPTPDGGAKGDSLPLQQTTSASTGNASTTQPGEESTKKRSFHDKVKSARAFVEDYLDRRAQAEYIAKNSDSTLAKQTSPPQFRSRYADPNNTTNNDLFGLLTGGHVHSQTLGVDRRAARKQWRNERRMARGLAPRNGPAGPVGFVLKGVKKVLKEDVLYLMVVNLPSQEELEEAKRVLLEHGWMKRMDDLKKND